MCGGARGGTKRDGYDGDGKNKKEKKRRGGKLRGKEEGRRKETIAGGNRGLPIVLCSQERTRVVPLSTRHGVSDMNKTEYMSSQPTDGE